MQCTVALHVEFEENSVLLPYMRHVSADLVYYYPTCGMLSNTVYCCWLGILLPYMWHVEGYSALLFSVLLLYMWHVNIISTNLVYYYLHASCWGIQCTVIGLVYYCPTCGMLRDTMYCYWLSVLLPYMWHVERCSVLLLAYCTIALHGACWGIQCMISRYSVLYTGGYTLVDAVYD